MPPSALQVAVRVRPFDRERRVLDPAALARLQVDELGLEAAALGPAQVHAQQHLRPVLRLGAARARMDRDDGVAGVVLAAEHLLHLHLGEKLLDLGSLALCLGVRVGFALGGHFEEHLAVAETAGEALPRVERGLQLGALLQELLRGLRVAPKVRRAALLGELGGAALELSDVKDASRAYRRAFRGRSACRESRRPTACRSFLCRSDGRGLRPGNGPACIH